MSDAFWIALFASLPATLAAIVAAYISLKGLMTIKGVHKQINSRMDQLLEITARSSRAEGIEEERVNKKHRERDNN